MSPSKERNITISITKSGFRFNADFIAENRLQGRKGLNLIMFKDKSIGFKFLKHYKPTIGVRKLTERGRARELKATSFFSKYNLDLERLRGWHAPTFKRHKRLGGVYIIRPLARIP